MKKYHFKFTEALFQAPDKVQYNIVNHKILNELLEEIDIVVVAEKIDEASKKVEETMKEIISTQLSDYPGIEYFKFGVAIRKIEELT